MRFCFVHAADLHLDTPFSGLAQVSEEAAALLRDASLAAFDAVVRLALERKAAFVLLAGDLYDGEERGVRAQLRFLQGVEQLAAGGVRTFVVHGNHDPIGGWSAVRRWPDEMTVFGSDRVVGVPVETQGRILATVYGLSYGRRDVSENLSLRFPEATGRGPAQGIKIGLLHCSVGDQPEHSPYSPCSLADLGRAGVDYWALGHIHRAAVLKDGAPWIVYPGDTQGRSAKPAEMGAKGVMLVEVEGASVRSVEFMPTDSVRFLEMKLDIGALDEGVDLGGLRAELQRRAAALRQENAGRSLLVRALLEGRGPLHRDLAATGAAPDLLRDLRDADADAEPPLWWESLHDLTRPEIDLQVVRSRDDFASALLVHAEETAADRSRLNELGTLLTPTTPADLARRCGAPSEDELSRLLEEASMMALEALESEEPPCT